MIRTLLCKAVIAWQIENRGIAIDLVVDTVELHAKIICRWAGNIVMLYMCGLLELKRCETMRGWGWPCEEEANNELLYS